MSASVAVRGLEAAIADVRQIERLAEPQVAVPAMLAAGRVLAAAMASRIRRKSGQTAASIEARLAKPVAGDAGPVVIVGPSQGRQHIARFLENGTLRINKRTDTVTHIPAYPFANPALDASEGEMGQVFEAELVKSAGLT